MFATDTGAFILNEAAVQLTGFAHPVGQVINWHGKDHVITGVVTDMVMQSPYKRIQPAIFFLNYGAWLDFITLRISPTLPLKEALSKIEPVFGKYNPGSPFIYKFTDEEYAKKFSDEQRVGNLATILAVLAIFISSLGLFGLTSFVAEQRTREIGIRKVLGASVFNLWKMLTQDFILLVAISYLVAIPITVYFMHQWLQKYEYRIGVSGWVFVLTGGGALLITLMTVSYQTMKTALTNPAKSLKEE